VDLGVRLLQQGWPGDHSIKLQKVLRLVFHIKNFPISTQTKKIIIFNNYIYTSSLVGFDLTTSSTKLCRRRRYHKATPSGHFHPNISDHNSSNIFNGTKRFLKAFFILLIMVPNSVLFRKLRPQRD
jgi:hypothetical protein